MGVGSEFKFEINADAMQIDASIEEMNSIPTEEDCSINSPMLAENINKLINKNIDLNQRSENSLILSSSGPISGINTT